MTVMVFQLDGSDQTLQEGMRTINSAIQGMVRPSRIVLLPAGASVQPGGEEAEHVAEEVLKMNGEEVESPQVDGNGNRRSSTPKPPQVLPELKVPVDELKEFCEAKHVGNKDTKRYLAIASFLKEKMGISAVSGDHIHTCYRLMGWNTPKDAGSPLRTLKRQGFFQKGDESGTYILNHVGENAARDMGKDSDAT